MRLLTHTARYLKIISLLLLFTYTAKAQKNEETQKFLSDIFEKATAKQTFIYTNKIWPAYYDEITGSLKADTLRNDIPTIKQPILIILSQQEKEYILNRLNEQKANTWPDHLFPNSKLVLFDTVTNILNDNGRGWPYLNHHYGKGFHSFTQPVFLRNNTLCFFYSDYTCGGLCGSGDFSVYQKHNGVWEKIILLFSWVS